MFHVFQKKQRGCCLSDSILLLAFARGSGAGWTRHGLSCTGQKRVLDPAVSCCVGTPSTGAVRVSSLLLAPGNLCSSWKRNGCGHKPRVVMAEGKGPHGSTDDLRRQIFKTMSGDEGERRGEQA